MANRTKTGVTLLKGRRGNTGKSPEKNIKSHAASSDGVDFYDYNLLAVVVLLTCFGLVMLYSTSAYEASVDYGNDMRYFARQAGIGAVSFIIMVYGSRVDYHKYSRLAGPLYLISNLLLIATKFVGRTINGARRWIYFGPISFQPAELAKLAVILFLPCMIVGYGYRFRKVKVPMIVMCTGLTTALLTYVFTENLSTGIIIAGITYVLVLIAHPHPRKMVIATLIIVVVMVLALLILRAGIRSGGGTDTSSFRLQRIITWLDPENNQDSGGYQATQALYAIGSGGLFGKGLGNSTQKLGSLPEAQNDMIFSIICEELGIVGAVIVLLLFAFLLSRLVFIAMNAPDLQGSLIATGIFAHISLQVVLNIAVVVGALPTTGVTLPFVSYGGTSIAFLMMEMMLALSVSGQIRIRKV